MGYTNQIKSKKTIHILNQKVLNKADVRQFII